VQHLSNHKKSDGSKLTGADIRVLGRLRLRYPRT
jgi:hypothetical protein